MEQGLNDTFLHSYLSSRDAKASKNLYLLFFIVSSLRNLLLELKLKKFVE